MGVAANLSFPHIMQCCARLNIGLVILPRIAAGSMTPFFRNRSRLKEEAKPSRQPIEVANAYAFVRNDIHVLVLPFVVQIWRSSVKAPLCARVG